MRRVTPAANAKTPQSKGTMNVAVSQALNSTRDEPKMQRRAMVENISESNLLSVEFLITDSEIALGFRGESLLTVPTRPVVRCCEPTKEAFPPSNHGAAMAQPSIAIQQALCASLLELLRSPGLTRDDAEWLQHFVLRTLMELSVLKSGNEGPREAPIAAWRAVTGSLQLSRTATVGLAIDRIANKSTTLYLNQGPGRLGPIFRSGKARSLPRCVLCTRGRHLRARVKKF